MTHPLNLATILRSGKPTTHELVAADELERLHGANKHLVERVAALEGGLRKHRHTEQCFKYAARTARQHGNAYCIAICSDSHKELDKKDA